MPQAVALAATAIAAIIPASTGAGLVVGGTFLSAAYIAGSVAVYGGLAASAALLSRSTQPDFGLGGSNIGAVNSPEARGSIKQDIPPHRLWLGETRGGGVVYFYEVKPPYLYIGLIHSLLPISSISKVFIAEQELTFRSFTENQVLAPLPISGLPAYDSRVQVCFQFGAIDQGVNALISQDFPELGTDFKLPGIANSVWRFDYGSSFDEFQSLYGNVSIPDAKIVAKGCPLPDPRNPSHRLSFDPRDSSDLYDAIATWDYSNNAALAGAFWAALPFGLNAGPDAVYSGDYVDLLKVSADFDDEAVPLAAGGTQRRHTVDGILVFDQKPLSVMEAMTAANGGFVSPRAGKVIVSSSQPRDPIITISDADVIAWASYKNARAKRDLVNTPKARFVTPEGNYQDAETSWPSQAEIDALVAEDGEVFEQTLTLGLVNTAPRAQRILKSYVNHTRLDKSLAITCRSRLFGVTEGQVVRVEFAQYPSANGLYSVEEWGLTEDFSGVTLVLAEYDPSIPRDWTASVDEQPFEVPSLDVAA